MKLYKTPGIFKRIYPDFLWTKNTPHLYLSFDDGPHPEITPWALDVLKKHHVKATFFVLGENVSKHPDIYQRILDEGHSVGNHTMNHLKGRKTDTKSYVENVEQCAQLVDSNLFRPPYGSIKPSQSKALLQLGYEIVMWDVMAYDWIDNMNAQHTLESISKATKPGSIIVFHDNKKSIQNLKSILSEYIVEMKAKGFSFEQL